jgi:DNA-directed RNA polymerase specialized sigma24 family protein
MQPRSDTNQKQDVDWAVANAAMERYACGDNVAFSDVYDALAPALFDRLLSWTEDSALAEDLTQKTLLRLHHARGRFIRGSSVATWAFAIADRVATDNALGLDVAAPSLLARARNAFTTVRAMVAVRAVVTAPRSGK